jgi:hypothetical protein
VSFTPISKTVRVEETEMIDDLVAVSQVRGVAGRHFADDRVVGSVLSDGLSFWYSTYVGMLGSFIGVFMQFMQYLTNLKVNQCVFFMFFPRKNFSYL